jgi:hypothetical protein
MGRRGEEEESSSSRPTTCSLFFLSSTLFFFLARSLNVVLSKFVVLPYLTYYLINSCDTVRF